MTRVLVTGGKGALGREVVKQLVERGYTVRIMSRRGQPAKLVAGTEWAQADLDSGQGVAEAVGGSKVILHAASSVLRHTRQIDVEGTRLLLEKARAANVAHIVYISIVGVDRIPFAYYQHKLAAEAVIKSGTIPWSILRATQFHYLLDLYLQAATKLPLTAVIPTDLQFQTIATDEVASCLCEIVTTGPREPGEQLTDIGGPQVQTLGEMANAWLNIRGLHRTVIPLRLPGKVAQSFRRGYNTCPDHVGGKLPWSQWVRRKYQ